MTSTLNAPATCPYCGTEHGPKEPMRVGALWLNPERREVSVGKHLVRVTPTEYRILSTLMRTPGKVVKKQTLTAVFGGPDTDTHHALDVFICRLRKKISSAAHIKNVFATGYLIEEADSDVH